MKPKDQAVQTLAFAQVHGSDIGIGATFEAAQDILDGWEA
jgi:hypothetical protein